MVQTKTLVRRYIDLFNAGDLESLDPIVAVDYREHSWQAVVDGATSHSGIGSLKRNLRAQREAFPDLYVTIYTIIADADLVTILWRAHGTHRGTYLGVRPTGKRMTFAGTTTFRVAGDRLQEEWALSDRGGTWLQIGLLPRGFPNAIEP